MDDQSPANESGYKLEFNQQTVNAGTGEYVTVGFKFTLDGVRQELYTFTSETVFTMSEVENTTNDTTGFLIDYSDTTMNFIMPRKAGKYKVAIKTSVNGAQKGSLTEITFMIVEKPMYYDLLSKRIFNRPQLNTNTNTILLNGLQILELSSNRVIPVQINETNPLAVGISASGNFIVYGWESGKLFEINPLSGSVVKEANLSPGFDFAVNARNTIYFGKYINNGTSYEVHKFSDNWLTTVFLGTEAGSGFDIVSKPDNGYFMIKGELMLDFATDTSALAQKVEPMENMSKFTRDGQYYYQIDRWNSIFKSVDGYNWTKIGNAAPPSSPTYSSLEIHIMNGKVYCSYKDLGEIYISNISGFNYSLTKIPIPYRRIYPLPSNRILFNAAQGKFCGIF